jgi:hypothetical protein
MLHRANTRVLAVVVGVALVAASNALIMPLQLEQQIFAHGRTAPILAAYERGVFAEGSDEFDKGLEGGVLGLQQAFRAVGCENISELQRCACLASLRFKIGPLLTAI